ncbi:MAG: hypothetical protein HOP02_10290 [Methylococcaceae bacterium]|nr:hypothetical protein [Methylococcaceae bacterium]
MLTTNITPKYNSAKTLNPKEATPDVTPPIPVSVIPNNQAERVSISSNILVTLDEKVQAGNGNIIISNGQGDTRTIAVTDKKQISFSFGKGGGINGESSNASTQVVINPSRDLLSNSQYYVLVDDGAIVDLAGNAFAGTQDSSAYTFKTVITDTVAPVLKENPIKTPLADAFALQFNEAILAGSGTIVITDSQGNKRSIAIHDNTQVLLSSQPTFPGSTNPAALADTLLVMPKDGLIAGSEYFVQLDSGVVTDFQGNPFAGVPDTSLSFIAADQSNAPPIPIKSSPTNGQEQVALASDIKLSFNEPVAGGPGHFIISNGHGDTRIIAGNDASQIAFNARKPSTIPSEGGKSNDSPDYSVITINPKEDLLAGSQYFIQMERGAVVDAANTPVASVMDSTALTFTTVALDSTAPIALSSSPSVDAQQVPIKSNITVQFDEPIKAGSGNFILTNSQGDAHIIRPTFSGNEISIYYPRLQPNSSYSLQVDNTAITDLQGNAFAGGTLNFTTAADTTAPELGSFSFPVALVDNEIRIFFSELIKLGTGQLVFDNKHGDTRTIAIDDQSQVSINENRLIIHLAQPLPTGSFYEVRMDSGIVTDLSGNAFAGGESHLYMSSTTTPEDTTSPAFDKFGNINSTGNSKGAHQVNANITLEFNDGIKAATGHITLSDGKDDARIIDINDNSQVEFRGKGLIINPSEDLHSNSHYTVQIDSGVITDFAGNAFAGTNDTTSIAFDTSGKAPGVATNQPVQEINQGGAEGVYDTGDVLVFNFDTAVTRFSGFGLLQHSFGGRDVVLSADGLSASVELDANSTITTGDVLYLTGLSDAFGNTGDVIFTL